MKITSEHPIKQRHLAVVVVLFAAITASHYTEVLVGIPVINYVSTAVFGLGRHAPDRLLYVLLVAYAGWFLGVRWGVVTLAVAMVMMIPRAVWLSPLPRDAVFEMFTAVITGGLLLTLVYSIRRGRKHRENLVSAMALLKESETEYRELFENASDAIWIHDLEGKIIHANKATEKLNGYSLSEMVGKNVGSFLSEDGHTLAHDVKAKLLGGQPVQPRYEQRLYRKDGSEAVVELTTRLITYGDKPIAFQNIARDVTQERRLQASLHFYLQQILEAQEAERKRIARDLHDDTAQSLLYIIHQLDSVLSDRNANLIAEVSERLLRLHTIAVNTHDSLRRYTKQLRPAILDDLGLGPALEWLADNLTAETEADVTVQLSPIPPDLSHEVQLTLFRIAQEALSNIKRHAGATQAGIRLARAGNLIRMTISDNGKGFDVPTVLSDFSGTGKLGLAGMQERIQLLGGNLNVQSTAGRGTTIVVEVPAYPVGTVKTRESGQRQ
ncbi:MAG: PAS domain S-box protein [Chloroflexota bacterium]